MTQFKSEFLATLHERGFIHQIPTPRIDKAFASGIVTGYIGTTHRPRSMSGT